MCFFTTNIIPWLWCLKIFRRRTELKHTADMRLHNLASLPNSCFAEPRPFPTSFPRPEKPQSIHQAWPQTSPFHAFPNHSIYTQCYCYYNLQRREELLTYSGLLATLTSMKGESVFKIESLGPTTVSGISWVCNKPLWN